MAENINIPSSISSKLQQINLYMKRGRATAFVGAGFSLNADIPANVTMKTWQQLRETFLSKLYVDNDEEKSKDHSDVIRLASMVAAQFKHNELDRMLEDSLPDMLVTPGKLHKDLVELPWKDILTTNYDTLLERALQKAIADYRVVTNKDTLLYKPSPRIIKLHGSFPDIHPYVMTSDDYRRYPIDHPEMVNTVRQCFLESIVCLIGFSGDDPNFQAWLGWLRDVIGKNRLCPAYLITWNPNYSDAERTYMSHSGIDVINLAEIKGIEDYKHAFDFFFRQMKDSSGYNQKWEPSISISKPDSMGNAEIMKSAESLYGKMKAIRLSYPGWLVLPTSYYMSFDDLNHNIYILGKYYSGLQEIKEKINFLYEVNWRLTISATPKSVNWFISGLEDLMNRNLKLEGDEKKMMVELKLALLTIYRHKNLFEEFDKLSEDLLKDKLNVPSGKVYNEQALKALSLLDFKEVESILLKWDVNFADYRSYLQKANLLIFLNRKLEAYRLLLECKDVIRKVLLQKKDDKFASSSLGYIMRIITWCSSEREEEYKDEKGESLQEITDFLSKSAYEESPRNGYMREHKFGIADYVNTRYFNYSGYVKPYLCSYRWILIKELCGIAVWQFDPKFFEYSLKQLFVYSWSLAWNYLIICGDEGVAERVIGRDQLNGISRDDANKYYDRYIPLIENSKGVENEIYRHRLINVVKVVLAKLCDKVSKDRVVRFAKAILLWSPKIVSKQLSEVYDYMENDDLAEVVGLILNDHDKSINTIYNIGYPLPDDRMELNYQINENLIQRVLYGLDSDKDAEQIGALWCLIAIWYSENLSEDYKKKLTDAVIQCRKKDNLNLEIQKTFNWIEVEDSEKEHLQNIVKDAVNSYCGYDAVVTNSSEPVSKWKNLMNSINIYRSWLDHEQRIKILKHTFSLIEKNKNVLEKNDAGEWLFGMRHFTQGVICQVSSFLLFLDITKLDNADKNGIKELANWLYTQRYYSLPLLVKYNMEEDNTCSDDVLKKVKKAFFSNDHDSNNDALNAFFYLVDLEFDFSKLLATMFDAIDVSNRAAFNRILFLFANLIARGYSDPSFIQKVKNFLLELHRQYEDDALDSVVLADSQGYANYVAGSLSYSIDKSFQPVFDFEESRFNDVVIYFDKGRALARREALNRQYRS